MGKLVLLAIGCLAGAVGCFLAALEVLSECQRAVSVSRRLDGKSFLSEESSLWLRGLRTVEEAFSYWLRNGIDACNSSAEAMLKFGLVRRFCHESEAVLQAKGIQATDLGVASTLIALVLAGVALLFVLVRSVACLFVPILVVAAVVGAVHKGLENRDRMLRDQMPEALRCMDACLYAGLSMPQAFLEAQRESPSPAKEMLGLVVQDLEMGFSMQQALRKLYEQSNFPELAFVAMSLDVVYACGGSAAPVLRSAQESLSSSVELKRLLSVQTAQARLSARIVALMPLALMAVLSLVSPGFLSPFFESVQGVCIFACALFMEVLGIFAVHRTLDVRA